MKKTIVFLAVCFVLANQIIEAQWSGGNGSEMSPYQITTLTQLNLLADSTNNFTNWSHDKHFRLMNDITDSMRKVIGSPRGTEQFCFANAVFDGQGYRITLAIDSTSNTFAQQVGLFGNVSGNFTIKNLSVNGYVRGRAAGGIVGRILVVDQLHKGNIRNCINMANVSSPTYTAGIVAVHAYRSWITTIDTLVLIEDCINIGNIRNTSNGTTMDVVAGGIVGGAQILTINRCVNYGYVSSNYIAGGIAGICFNSAKIENSVNVGLVRGANNQTGCIVGRITSPSLINNWWDRQMCPFNN